MKEKELDLLSADEFFEELKNGKDKIKKEIEQRVRSGSCTASVSEMDHRVAVQQYLDSIETELTIIRYLLVKVLVVK